MCGINGILNFNGRPLMVDDLQGMNAKMIHRGPDDDGYYTDGNMGLAMRRLSIIDLQGGHQPISNESGRIWVVLNGEIYNYIELRKELESRGHLFKTKSDTEVLVHLYEDMGEQCLNKLNGMFTFAIWDSYKKELLVANDRLGIKPLFYYKNSSFFAFSSELKSLITLDVDREIDRSSFLLYLFLLYVPYPRSMVKDVCKLEPATLLKIDGRGNITKKTYWKIENFNSVEQIDFEEFRDTFITLLTDAIRLQLRSDVPIGTFLSGGVDSSCIVAMLSNLNKGAHPIRTFSVGYEGHFTDERQYAAQVAKLFKTKHTEFFITTSDVKKNLRRIIWFMDEPVGDSAMLPAFLLSEMARESGVKVLLNGTGGDEIFGGYRRYLETEVRYYLRKKLNTMSNLALSLIARPFSLYNTFKSMNGLMDYCCNVSGSFMGLRSFLKDDSWFGMLTNHLDITLGNEFDQLITLPKVDRLMHFDLRTYLVGDLLFLLDKMTMAASIEARVPLIDHRMVEFMATIPASLKIKDGNLKSLVKKALKGILPDTILAREKMGFGGPVSFWLSEGILDKTGIFEDGLSTETKELFKQEKLMDTLKNRKHNRWNAQFLYNLAVFELWYWNVLKG